MVCFSCRRICALDWEPQPQTAPFQFRAPFATFYSTPFWKIAAKYELKFIQRARKQSKHTNRDDTFLLSIAHRILT